MPYSNVPQHLKAKLAAILGDARAIERQALTEAQVVTPRHDAVAVLLQERGLIEAGARHTQREFQIIEQVIQLMTELYGEIDDLGVFVDKLTNVKEAIGTATVVDYLISIVHSSFTTEADALVGDRARLSQDERIFLSHAIGCALDAFNACIDAERPDLRLRTLWEPPDLSSVIGVTPPVQVNVTTSEPPEIIVPAEPEDAFELMAAARPVAESSRSLVDRALSETINGAFSIDANQRHPDGSFILGGRMVIEGRSTNGNRYTLESLRSGPPAFAGQYIFIDHPSLSESQDRPERSEYDKVGLLPKDPRDFYIEAIKEGEHAGKQALFFRNGKLSQTVDWLATRIKEGISGEMSINAHGRGIESEDGSEEFVVEAFVPTPLTSLDFVTKGAAGGRGLLEASRSAVPVTPLEDLTVAQLVERRPELLAALAAQTRETFMQEANAMTVKLTEAQTQIVSLKAALRKHRQQARKEKADRLIGEALAGSGLPTEGQARVRSLLESPLRRFVEAGEDPEGEPPGELAPTGTGLSNGDPAAIELPPDVAALPAEAQAAWLETYVGALPKGEKRATNLAWAAVYGAGWVEGDKGWYKEQPDMPMVDQPMLMTDGSLNPVMASAKPLTLDALKQAVTEAVQGEKTYLGKVTNAGAISDLGGSSTTTTAESNEMALEEAFAGLLPAAQAKVAAAGRGQTRKL